MSRPRTQRLSDERGVALMLVLWLIVLLGFVATQLIARGRAEIDSARSVRARAVAKYAAESGLETVVERLERLLRRERSLEGRAAVFQRLDLAVPDTHGKELGTARFQVSLEDLSAKIDLNLADEATLFNFFSHFTGREPAVAIVDALEDWKDPDDMPRPRGSEIGEYRATGSPFIPANRFLLRVDDLRRVLGVSDAVASAVAPYVTVRGNGRVNVNTAPELVLRSLSGIEDIAADHLLSRRETGAAYQSIPSMRNELVRSSVPLGIELSRLATHPSRILIVSRGWEDGHPLTHEIQAVYDLEGLQLETGPRLRLAYWTERDL